MAHEFLSSPQTTSTTHNEATINAITPTHNEAMKPALTTITISFSSSYLLMAFLTAAFLLGFSVRDLINERIPHKEPDSTPLVPTVLVEDLVPEVKRYSVPVDDDPSLGPANAPVTIIEFSDFECPFCRKWHLEVYPVLVANYPDKLRFVYKDSPMGSIHKNAIGAAEAANCAGEQGAFWEFHDRLFSMELGLNAESYTKYAKELGLDTKAFQECLSSRRYFEEVQADLQFASNLGLRGTPTFFINGRAVVGAQPYEVFRQIIEQELAGSNP